MKKMEDQTIIEMEDAPEDEGGPKRVKRAFVLISDREIPLRYDLRVQIQVEDELDMDFYGLQDKLIGEDKKIATKTILSALRIMGNAGLRSSGQAPDLTEGWLLENVRLRHLQKYATALMGAMVAGWWMETDDSFNEKHDVVLEEIRKKNESTESPAGS